MKNQSLLLFLAFVVLMLFFLVSAQAAEPAVKHVVDARQAVAAGAQSEQLLKTTAPVKMKYLLYLPGGFSFEARRAGLS